MAPSGAPLVEKTGEADVGSPSIPESRKRCFVGNEEGALLAALAVTNHWKADDVAAFMGWSPGHVTNVLRGTRSVLPADLDRLKGALRSTPPAPQSAHRTCMTKDGYVVYLPKQSDLIGAAPFEAFGPWVHRIGFGSLCGQKAEAPKTHCSIDRVLLRAEPRSLAVAGLEQSLPSLTKDQRKSLRRMDPRERRPLLPRLCGDVISDEGEPIRIEWVISEIDVHEPYHRKLRFKRNFEIVVAGTEIVLGVLSLRPNRKRCTQHRLRRGKHKDFKSCPGIGCPSGHFWRHEPKRHRCGSCAFNNDAFWRCKACASINACADCDALSAAQPGLRLDITGTAWRRGLGTGLLEIVRNHFAERGTIALQKVDLAIDVEAPFASLVPFVCPEATWRPKRIRVHRMPIGASIIPTGQDLGGAELRLCVYDLLAAARYVPSRRGRRYELPAHAVDVEHLTRFELKIKVQKGETPAQVVQKAIECFSSIGVADLRRADSEALQAPFLVLAKERGIQPGRELSLQKVRKQIGRPRARRDQLIPIVVAPSASQMTVQKPRKKVSKARRPMPLDAAEVLLDRLGEPQRAHAIAEDRARVIRTVILDDLDTLSRTSAISLGATAADWADTLRGFLEKLLDATEPPESLGADWPPFWTASISNPASPRIPASAPDSHAPQQGPLGNDGGSRKAKRPEDLDALLDTIASPVSSITSSPVDPEDRAIDPLKAAPACGLDGG